MNAIHSDQVNELFTALAKAQGEMQNAAFNRVNPAFKSKYADLSAVRDATMPALTKNGLSLVQVTTLNTTEMLLITRLGHTSGQWLQSVYPIPVSDRPHIMGSALTYARRYSWAAICGVASEEDEDGNAAQEAGKNGTPKVMLARKSSAAAKRDGDWPKFERALADTQSASEVARLRNEYVRDIYPTWNRDWQDTADQEFNKRLAEFSQPGALKQTLKDSIEAIGSLAEGRPTNDPDETFHDCWKYLENAKTLTDLIMRTDNPGFKEGLQLVSKDQWNQLKAFKAQRMEELGGIEPA